MTPVEIAAALDVFRSEGGKEADATLWVSRSKYREDLVSATFYPNGVSADRHAVTGRGNTFEEALANLRAEWDASKALADKNATRKMALTIIEITTDQGECSDAALRGAGFTQAQIDRIGESACHEATRLAAGGPFAIVSSFGANAEAA